MRRVVKPKLPGTFPESILRPFCMGVVKNIPIGLYAGIVDEIRPGEIGSLEPSLLRWLRIFEIEHAAAILAEALFSNASRECSKLLFRIDHFDFSPESHPRHECRTMKPLALRAVAMSSPKRRQHRLEFYLAAVTTAFSVSHTHPSLASVARSAVA